MIYRNQNQRGVVKPAMNAEYSTKVIECNVNKQVNKQKKSETVLQYNRAHTAVYCSTYANFNFEFFEQNHQREKQSKENIFQL